MKDRDDTQVFNRMSFIRHNPFPLDLNDEMRETYQSLSDRNDLEVIFVRAAGSDADIPYGLHFLGYDVCYPPGGDGFSAICDCMFLCRWHGCDEAGTEFTDDFMRLNENGLFDSKQEAEI